MCSLIKVQSLTKCTTRGILQLIRHHKTLSVGDDIGECLLYHRLRQVKVDRKDPVSTDMI